MSWPIVMSALGVGLLLGLIFKPPAVAAVSLAVLAWAVWLWARGEGMLPAIVALVLLEAAYLAGIAVRLKLRERRPGK